MCFAQVKSYRAKPKGASSRKPMSPEKFVAITQLIMEKTGIGDSLRRLGMWTQASQEFGLFNELRRK